jgi:hypothetical protein
MTFFTGRRTGSITQLSISELCIWIRCATTLVPIIRDVSPEPICPISHARNLRYGTEISDFKAPCRKPAEKLATGPYGGMSRHWNLNLSSRRQERICYSRFRSFPRGPKTWPRPRNYKRRPGQRFLLHHPFSANLRQWGVPKKIAPCVARYMALKLGSIEPDDRA